MSGLTPGGRPATGSNPSIPPRVSDAGLPSGLSLIARTSSTLYETPTGLEAYRKPELWITGNHKIKAIWEDGLARKVLGMLSEKEEVELLAMGIFRFRYAEEKPAEVILFVGVKPGSLSYEKGNEVAVECKGLLLDHGINDVEVEIREAKVYP